MKGTNQAEDEGYVHSRQLGDPSYSICQELRDLYDRITDLSPTQILGIIESRQDQTLYHPYHSPEFEEIRQGILSGSFDANRLESALMKSIVFHHRHHHGKLRCQKPGGICDICGGIEDYRPG